MEKILVSKAANLLSVHSETVRRLERRGVLKAKRDYRGFRVFDLDEILRVKEERAKLK